MAASLRAKGMLKERKALEKETTEYVCFFNDGDTSNFFCYLVGPEDSVYRHKLVQLQFEIPPRYPLVPPKVNFVQHRGDRIHPSLYVEGKLCLSILEIWPGESWALSMTTDSVLHSVQSLLDNCPYLHEPVQRDNPAFNDFVRHSTWRWLLLDYVDNETHPAAKVWLQRFFVKNADMMTTKLHRQQAVAIQGAQRVFVSPYQPAGLTADYPALLRGLYSCLQAAKTANLAAATLNIAPGLPEPETAGLRAQSASVPPKTVGAHSSRGGLSACGAQLKRKLCSEAKPHAPPAPGQLGMEQSMRSSATLTFNQLCRPEPPQKHSKKEPKVIDLM